MAITKVTPDDSKVLGQLADKLSASKRVVMVTGAGISTNCGIPDFRSQDGLYSLIHSEYNTRLTSRSSTTSGQISGKDLFDASLWRDELRTSVFYTFIASLRRRIREDVKNTTATHRFIRLLRDKRKLVRCYTQNIDGLEARDGLCLDIERGQGSRGRFTPKAVKLPKSASHLLAGGTLDGGCEVVQLHGDLDLLRCTLCSATFNWDEEDREKKYLAGAPTKCDDCVLQDWDRRDRGKRGTTIGTLRPNIVLYGEEHPAADKVAPIITNDLKLRPDVLLIMGTSLKVHGLKTLVREFAKAVHDKGGIVLFVNKTKPADSTWNDSIDYWVNMDCDAWVEDLKKRRGDMWATQTSLDWKVIKSKTKTKSVSKRSESMKTVPQIPERAIAAPATPKRRKPRKPFDENEDQVTVPNTPSKIPHQLLTPPSTRHRQLKNFAVCAPARPAKRRKVEKDVKIWEDMDAYPVKDQPPASSLALAEKQPVCASPRRKRKADQM